MNEQPLIPHLNWPQNFNEVPKESFVRPDIYRAEVERIFYGREWHPIAHESEIPNLGDFKTTKLVDVPLLISRGQDGTVRVFFNDCSHRGNQLETAPFGTKKEFECPYHRWLFSTEGQLIGCPNQSGYSPGFNRKDYPLSQPRTESYLGLIFVTFSPDTESLDEFLGEDMKPTLADLMGGDGRLKLLGYQKVSYRSNWKVYADNDGYHAPLLHKAFGMLNWQGGKGRQFTTTKRGHIGFESQLSVSTGGNVLKDPSIIAFKGEDPSIGTRIVELFPTFVSTKHLDVINLRFANPLGVDKVEVHYAYFAHQDDNEELLRHRLRQSSNLLGPSGMVSLEDASIFNRVFAGSFTPGNAIFQKGVKDFRKLPATELEQNEESGNLARWEYYRTVMEFARSDEA